MGRLDVDPVINHFSHQHALKLLNLQSQATNTITCAGCKLEATRWIYGCSTCNYYLHKACSQMPQQIKHYIDRNHTLNLLPLPVYPEGTFRCNGCGKLGTGFCYHCKECELDLHTLCAHMPSPVKINTHHHTLNLCFYPPHQNKLFQCDICHYSGSNHWLYHCQFCEFDAHLNCAVANLQSNQQQQQKHTHLTTSSSALPPFPATVSQFTYTVPTVHHLSPPATWVPSQQLWNPPIQTGSEVPSTGSSSRSQPVTNGYTAGMPIMGVPQFIQPPRKKSLGNDLVGLVVTGAVDGMAQQAGQILLQSFLGGSN